MQISESIEKFLTTQAASNKSELTIDVYRREFGRLTTFTGDIDITGFTPDIINNFILSDLAQKTPTGRMRSEITISRLKACLRSFGNFLVDHDIFAKNPARGLAIKRTVRQEPTFLSADERKLLIKVITRQRGEMAERDRVIFELFLGTGIRLSELVNLNICDVRLDDKKITIKAKGGRSESRFINSHLRRLLKNWLRKRRDMVSASKAFFLSNRGSRITRRQVQRRFSQWVDAAGITKKLTVHSLRHTFASSLYGRTRNLILVSKALGHRQVATTQVYTHLFDHELEDAIEDMA